MDDQTLERVSRRAGERPEFWAWVFDRYVHWRGPASAGVASHLGLAGRDFLRLGLYLRPRAGRFEEDVRLAAADFAIDPFRLAAVARFVDAMEAMQGATKATHAPNIARPADERASDAGAGFLAAARPRRPRRRGRPGRPNRPSDGGQAP